MKLTKNDWFGAGSWLGLTHELGVGLGLCLLWMALGSVSGAQAVSTTTVQGTVYLANGQVGTGTLVLSWPAFTTASGQSVAADSLTLTIAPDGFVSVNLAPNLGATPAGLYYTAVYYLSDGSSTTQYWVVPAAASASLAQVQAQLMPAAQAVQAVSKSYVDQVFAELEESLLLATGGTLSGPLYLSGDPTQPLQAADKHYVDAEFALAVPLAGGNMTGPLQTPAVNGVESPAAGSAQTTLQAAMTAAGSNGAMEIPPTYAGTDTFTNPNGVFVDDLRTSGAQQIERSVKEFGAVCDGVADDTNALQAALAYADTHGVTLTIPQGTCKTRQLNWHGESIGGLGKQVSALMGFPGQDVLASAIDSLGMLSYTRLHDLTIYVDQSVDVSCSPAEGRASAGTCAVGRPLEKNTIFSPGGNGLTGTIGSGAGWSVGNCAIAMPAVTGAGGNGLRVAEIENVEIATTGVDPLASQYPGAHSTHTCGLYLAQWPQWSEFRNIDIRGLNTGIAIPPLPGSTPAGLNSDSNRWQNITINATHAFTASAGSNNVLDNVVAMAGNSAATAEPPTGLVLDLSTLQTGWTVRNAVVLPAWNAVQPQLTVTAAGGAVTAVTVGSEHGLGFDPYGTTVPIAFSGSCTAAATATVNSSGAIGTVSVTAGGVGCSGTTTASVNAAGTWDTAAPVNLIGGQDMTLFAGNLLKGNGGYTVWNATNSQSSGTQLDGGGGNLPGGGTYPALVANSDLGSALAVDQFPGADIGAKLQACLGVLSASYGGTCDARNFTGSLSMGSNLTISTANATVLLPCATIATANRVIVTAGTRNVSLRGCALLGGSAASGSQGGTAFLYSGTGAMVQVGDPTYAVDTPGFHMDNVVINTTAATSAAAQGLAAYRTQEMNVENLYFLGNSNQTGMTLDGTGNYTGGSFFSNHFSGFQTAVNAIGHQVSNPATTDWMNASTFVRLHIDCATSSGSPIAGTYGINLQQGDGNTFTGGDVEGCNTALHLGANAQNNTIVGLRNENSNNQVVADTGSSYNNWMTGGTMFTGQLTDNGTRNSFLDTFHRSFNGIKGDWYGSQQDATVTNHLRLGIGAGNERGLLNEIQTDYGYRWIEGYSDATAGEQFYQIDDVLNNVNRLSIGQYNNGASSTNNQTVVNSAGTGAVVLNGSTNSGTGGVVIGAGGASAGTVATINNAGNAQFNGTLLVGGTSQSTGTMTVRNNADTEVDYYLWPGLTTSQKGSYTYKDWNGNSQWYMVKDASNNWALNSAVGGLDSIKAYQSTNSGDTYIDASNSSGFVRVNYETGSGTGFNIYGGSSSALYASFTGTTSIKFPGLAAGSGHSCLQVDTSGFLTNTGSACGSGGGGGGSGTVNSGTSGQIAYYTATGTTVGGESQVPITAGGTGASTAPGALTNLGAQAAIPGLSSDGANGINVTGNVTAANTTAYGTVEGAKIGPVFECDQFSGADVSIKANACNSAAISAGGGTIDLRNLLAGSTTGSQEIEINTPAGNSALIGVTALLPSSGTYTTTMVGGPATGATVYQTSGGSGYVSGDLIYPAETGFAYTGAATGAVFSVTATSGVVTALTLVSGGSGYLTSKYVTTTTNNAGTGLVVNLAAADCGMRLNGRGTIQGGSVGAGATSFQIVPASGHSSFVMDSAFCTDQASGYVRQEGGLKTTNPTSSPAYTFGTSHIRNVVDASTFNLLETSSGYDDGALIESACCGANFFSLHADSGNVGGYPVMIGPGGVLKNACTTSGSSTITVPYGHLTAKYLGDTLSAGTVGGATNLPGGTTLITAINSLTSITVSQAATATSGGQAACTTPSLTGGSGLTYHVSDPTVGTATSISLHNLVANSPGPGLQNVVVTGQTSGVNFYTSYLESNSAVDSSTSQAYVGSPAGQVNFNGLYAPGPAAGGTKYGIESDTPFGWCLFGGLSNAGLLDQGVKIPASTNSNMTYCKGGFTNSFNGANLLPDTDFKQGSTYWTLPSGVSIAAGAGAAGDNALSFTLSGTASGTIYIPVSAAIPNLQLNQTYTIGANLNAASMTAGTVSVELCSTSTCTSHYGKATASAGATQVVSATVNASSYTGPYFALVINGVTGSGTVTISEPFLVEGITPAYVESDLGFGSAASSGAAFSSVALNGGTPWTSSSSANSQVVTCPAGGTSTQYCGADGNWHTPSGAGTVTSFSAGNLSPLFTTSVATATSTPALSFSLSNAAQNSVLAGPASGGAGAPSYQTAPTISAANMTSFPTLNQNTTGYAAGVAGGGVGSLPYQSAANTTAFIGSPTTSGHTFVPAWQPSGSAIAPVSLDLANYLASPPAIGGTSAAAGSFSALYLTAIGSSSSPLCTTTGGQVTNSGCSGGSMVYPGAGVANSTGSAWGVSYSVGTSGAGLTQANGVNSWSAENTFSSAGAASTPSVLFSGTPYTSGTATTNYPMVSIWPSGATGPSTWSGAGTMLGINAASGFTGNLIDLRVNGASAAFTVSYAGAVTATNSINAGSHSITGNSFLISGDANSGLYAPSNGVNLFGSSSTISSGAVGRLALDMVGGGVAATLTAGAAISGTGTGYVAPACASSHVCSAMNGTVTFTTGSTAASAGVLLTITDATTHTNQPDCMANIVQSSSPYTAIGSYLFSYSTTVWTLNVGAAPSASTAYTVTYQCMGY